MKLIIFIFLIIYIEGFITRKPCYPPEKWQVFKKMNEYIIKGIF